MEAEIFDNIRKAILAYDREETLDWVKKAVEEKLDLIVCIEVITDTIREVGDGFGRGELWLPDLVGAANATSSAMPIIEDEIRKVGAKREVLGTIVLGTVCGDIHDIGKSMVSTFLTASNFMVHDLGINITSEQFIDAIQKYKADILAMSALLTTTAPEQRKVIEALKKEGLRDKVKIMVGGGAVTQGFAEEIGADGFEATAPKAVVLAKSLLGK